jgi:hypothetical protein
VKVSVGQLRTLAETMERESAAQETTLRDDLEEELSWLRRIAATAAIVLSTR